MLGWLSSVLALQVTVSLLKRVAIVPQTCVGSLLFTLLMIDSLTIAGA